MSKPLSERQFGEISFKFRRWSAELTQDQTIEDTLVPEFWKQAAATIIGYDKANPKGRGDIIEVRKPDTGDYLELLVTEVGSGYVRVRPIKVSTAPAAQENPDSAMTTKWNIGTKRHDVVRKSDGQVMAKDFQTKDSALAWIANFTQKLSSDVKAA